MKVLAIGNSFSQDATRYLKGIAHADGVDMKVVNLYIGGCPLRRHYINALEDKKDYSLEFAGETTGFYVSIKEALISDEWDVVTLQQASRYSISYDTYQPYLTFLAEYVRKYSPKAKLLIHETWAYEDGSSRLCEVLGYANRQEMLSDIKEAYQLAAQAIHADGIIPSGEVLNAMLDAGIPTVHRDSYHVSYGLGRYALGLTWYAALTGMDVTQNSFSALDEAADWEHLQITRTCVSQLVNKQI